MSIIFNSADIAETMNNGVSNVTGADSIITENYTNVVQHGIKIDMSVSEKTITGTPPLTFNSNGTPLIDYTIYGNSIQDGTPTPTSPVAVNGVGTLSSGNYIIPISTNAVFNINLNSVPTTRRIKKLVFTGNEVWVKSGAYPGSFYSKIVINALSVNYTAYCTHLGFAKLSGYGKGSFSFNGDEPKNCNLWFNQFDGDTTVTEFKAYLAQQYANGTPVTLWYVLATPETSTVNESLMKIGDYADSVSYSQSGVTIPTASGNNTLDVQTTPKPSNVSITYKGR